MKKILKSVFLIVGIVVAYKFLLQFVVASLGDWLYTLILLITPVVLFIMVGQLQATVWKQQVSFLRILAFCLSVSIAAGLGIGMVDYIVLKYGLTLFGTDRPHKVDFELFSFLMSYASWYVIIGLVSSTLIWSVLYIQKRRRISC
ncbi:MAG: hypothetical protein V4651_00655 [Bacteroidota bacterium]